MKTNTTIFFTVLFIAVFAISAHAQTANITSFSASSQNVASGDSIQLNWTGSDVDEYKLFLTCPASVSAIIEKGESCGEVIPFGSNAQASVKLTNTSTSAQSITIHLRAYGSQDKYDSSQSITVSVGPEGGGGDNGKGEPTGDASITFFSLSESTVTTSFNNNKPTARFTAYFSGEHTDIWKITLRCPVPKTVAGLEERIDLIKSGGAGVTSPSKEGQQCNVTQEGSASLSQFSFLLVNPFKTPQSVTLTLGAYTWDGTKIIRGDTESRTMTVLPN